MSNNKALYFFVMIVGISFVSCGDLTSGGSDVNNKKELREQAFSFDGIKLISDSIDDGRSEETYNQMSYVVSPTSRILIRYEDLANRVDQVHTGKLPIRVRLTAIDTAAADIVRNHFHVCPITSNWMMLATWTSAHPFDRFGGRWSTPGGDFDSSGCVQSIALPEEVPDADSIAGDPNSDPTPAPTNPDPNPDPTPDPDPAPVADPLVIEFDIESWFLNYVKGRSINNGLMIKSDVSAQIVGDASGGSSPRIVWYQEISP